MSKSSSTPPSLSSRKSRGDVRSSPSTIKRHSGLDVVAGDVVLGRRTSDSNDGVPVNEFGGVLVTPEQIKAAFQFLDIDRKNRVTAENLRTRLGIFYDQLGPKDLKLLLNDQHELTEDYLTTLLLTNEVQNFDPVAEAFKAYDPHETGFVSRDMLRFVFERLGFGALTDEDVDVLVACADADGDGRIGLRDFRRLLLQPQS